MEEFVFHFTGKGNQSYIMKDSNGEAVFEAICEKFTFFKDSPYRFCNHLDHSEKTMMVGKSCPFMQKDNGFGNTMESSFKVDGVQIWDLLEAEGYDLFGYTDGLVLCFDVTLNGVAAGHIRMGGTGLINPKYKDSTLGKMPTNGIYVASCNSEDVPAFFLLCMGVTKCTVQSHITG